MFDDLSRELRRLSQNPIEVSRPVPTDADGYIDKECPSDECLTAFKIQAEDWTNLVSDEVVYCPICRYEADSRHWFTTEQAEHIQRVGLEEMKSHLDQAFQRGTQRQEDPMPRIVVSEFLTLMASCRRRAAPMRTAAAGSITAAGR